MRDNWSVKREDMYVQWRGVYAIKDNREFGTGPLTQGRRTRILYQ